jgi:broad specificity phosphatase PhoE
MSEKLPITFVARHGETAWTLPAQHAGFADLPLTERRERNARSLGERLRATFAGVFTSPLRRAFRTCELAARADQVIERVRAIRRDNAAVDERSLHPRAGGAVAGARAEREQPVLHAEHSQPERARPEHEPSRPVIRHCNETRDAERDRDE